MNEAVKLHKLLWQTIVSIRVSMALSMAPRVWRCSCIARRNPAQPALSFLHRPMAVAAYFSAKGAAGLESCSMARAALTTQPLSQRLKGSEPRRCLNEVKYTKPAYSQPFLVQHTHADAPFVACRRRGGFLTSCSAPSIRKCSFYVGNRPSAVTRLSDIGVKHWVILREGRPSGAYRCRPEYEFWGFRAWSRQEQRRQDGDAGDYHQQLNEGEASTGRRRAVRIAMTATTTSSSMRVKPGPAAAGRREWQ